MYMGYCMVACAVFAAPLAAHAHDEVMMIGQASCPLQLPDKVVTVQCTVSSQS